MCNPEIKAFTFTFRTFIFPLYEERKIWGWKVFFYEFLLINNECRANFQVHRKKKSANKERGVNLKWIIYFQYCMSTFLEKFTISEMRFVCFMNFLFFISSIYFNICSKLFFCILNFLEVFLRWNFIQKENLSLNVFKIDQLLASLKSFPVF